MIGDSGIALFTFARFPNILTAIFNGSCLQNLSGSFRF